MFLAAPVSPCQGFLQEMLYSSRLCSPANIFGPRLKPQILSRRARKSTYPVKI
jgi:hypothetical protein